MGLMYEIVKGPTTLEINQFQSAFLPFIGKGFSSNYYQMGAFHYDILKCSSGTAGAPAVLSGDSMVAFLTQAGGKIVSNGECITVTVPADQSVLFAKGGSEKEQWDAYKKLVAVPQLEKVEPQPFWYLPEYVTWVEQKASAVEKGKPIVDVLNETLVLDYMKRIKALNLPLGKLTIDDGWQERISLDDWTDGYWRPDTTKFPKMERLCQRIIEEGFVPSLWMGIPAVPLSANIINERPELFDDMPEECQHVKNRYYYKPSQVLTEHFINIIKPYANMGFKKFKFDFFYGPRQRMRDIMKCLYTAVRSIDKTIEIESHHADPFFSCYLDAFRMNDVVISGGLDWKGLTLTHLNLGINNAYDCILNLDHAGGNNPTVSEEEYIDHLELYNLVPDISRYPVVSLLPDRYTDKALTELKRYLSKHTVEHP